MAQCIAVVNAGSSSVKFGFYDSEGEETLLVRGAVEQIGVSPTLSASDGDGNNLTERNWPSQGFTHAQAMSAVLDIAHEFLPEGSTIVGVGHRVVHGGTQFKGPAKVTPDVITVLEGFSPLAPLHQPHNLAPIKAIAQNRPDIPQVACFDTAFHQTQPHLAQAYALPRELSDEA